jgi:hypothetical protein
LKAIDYLRHHIVAGEKVLRTHDSWLYAVYGGLPQASSDWGVNSFGFSKLLDHQRDVLITRPSSKADDYLAQSFRWFVLDDQDHALVDSMNQWVHEGRAEQRAEFPPLRIYYLSR